MYIDENFVANFMKTLNNDLPDEMYKNYKKLLAIGSEINMMRELGDLFVRFSKLEKQHPNELSDFQDGIHKCQYILGMRIARYYEPELLPKK